MPEIERQPGRDYTLSVIIKDADNNPIDYSTITGLAIILSTAGKRIIAQWSKVAKPNYLTMEAGTNPGEVIIELPAEKTLDLVNQQTYLEVIRQENDSGTILNFGMKDGELLPFIYFTNSALTDIPNLL